MIGLYVSGQVVVFADKNPIGIFIANTFTCFFPFGQKGKSLRILFLNKL